MPLRQLHHHLLKSFVQTPSSSLGSAIDQLQPIQEVWMAFGAALVIAQSLTAMRLQPDYFDNIDELQNWAATNKAFEPNPWDGTGLVGPSVLTPSETPKLLICHDFKGGYTEDPFDRGYSFEFWHLVDTFIYFSHNRVTLPPRGWLDAARRHGSKILGTVIFEWAESKPDLRKCLYGEKLDSALSPTPGTDTATLTFSTKYASHLITLAQARKFDGYLINIETDLNFIPPVSSYLGKTQEEQDEDAASLKQEKSLAGINALISTDIQSKRAQRLHKNVTALLGWVEWLREEGKRRIGPHWEVIWYDSVTTAGKLEWQDALTPANAPFFINSDAILTNYTWARPPDPSPPGALPKPTRPQDEHHPALVMSANMAKSLNRSTRDVYIGIDVFGRNCFGGFAVGTSLNMILPSRNSDHAGDSQESRHTTGRYGGQHDLDDLGLSVALFAPGWTWEREKEGGGERTWSEWWEDELQFWFGLTASEALEEPVAPAVGMFFGPRNQSFLRASPAPAVSRPEPVTQLDTTNLTSGHRYAPPVDGQKMPSSVFYTNFNRGSGNSWWVRGNRVYDALSNSEYLYGGRGWTDVGSCFPKPDRIWPRPTLLHSGIEDRTAPLSSVDGVTLKTTLIDYDVWEGGTSLEVELHFLKDEDHTPAVDFSESSRDVLPLCTLHACHLTGSDSYALEVVVKRLTVFNEAVEAHSIYFQPCILWSYNDSSGGESYCTAQMSSSSAEIHELDNGWCSITLVAELDGATSHLPSEVVPVFALEIGGPLPRTKEHGATAADLKLIVGAISFTALPQAAPSRVLRDDVQLRPHTADPESYAFSLPTSKNNLLWKPVPPANDAPSGTLWGILSWNTHEGDTHLATGYYNIFVSRVPPDEIGPRIIGSDYVWLGTSTYEFDHNSFVVAGLGPPDIFDRGRLRASDEGSVLRVPGRSQHSAPSEPFPGDVGPPVYQTQQMYFVVEQVGYSIQGTTTESMRYSCKVEY